MKSGTVPDFYRETNKEKQECGEDRSLKDPGPETDDKVSKSPRTMFPDTSAAVLHN